MSNYVCCYCGEEFEDAASVNFYEHGEGPEETDVVCNDCLEDYQEWLETVQAYQERVSQL